VLPERYGLSRLSHGGLSRGSGVPNGECPVRPRGRGGEARGRARAPTREPARGAGAGSGVKELDARPGTRTVHGLEVAPLPCPGRAVRRELEVVSFEVDLAPLRLALADAAGFAFLQPFREAAEALMRDRAWEAAGLRWRLHLGDARGRMEGVPQADLVFFDSFSPASNPEMWTEEVLARVRAGFREEGEGALPPGRALAGALAPLLLTCSPWSAADAGGRGPGVGPSPVGPGLNPCGSCLSPGTRAPSRGAVLLKCVRDC
jgi:hypothetical protein